MKIDSLLTIIAIILLLLTVSVAMVRIVRRAYGHLFMVLSMLLIPLSAAVAASSVFFTSRLALGLAFSFAAFSSLVLTGEYPSAPVRGALSLLLDILICTASFFPAVHRTIHLILIISSVLYYLSIHLSRLLSPSVLAFRFRPETLVEDMLRSCAWLAACCASFVTLLRDGKLIQFLPGIFVLFPVMIMNINSRSPGKMSSIGVAVVNRARKSLRQVIRRPPEQDDPQKFLFNAIDYWIREEKAFLHLNLGQEAVAEHFCTNRTYVASAVTRFSGMSYSDYINSIRIDYAMTLAKENPKLTVHELATMSGYPLPTTFSMAFKRRMGMTPGEWLNDLRASKKKSVSLQPNN